MGVASLTNPGLKGLLIPDVLGGEMCFGCAMAHLRWLASCILSVMGAAVFLIVLGAPNPWPVCLLLPYAMSGLQPEITLGMGEPVFHFETSVFLQTQVAIGAAPPTDMR